MLPAFLERPTLAFVGVGGSRWALGLLSQLLACKRGEVGHCCLHSEGIHEYAHLCHVDARARVRVTMRSVWSVRVAAYRLGFVFIPKVLLSIPRRMCPG